MGNISLPLLSLLSLLSLSLLSIFLVFSYNFNLLFHQANFLLLPCLPFPAWCDLGFQRDRGVEWRARCSNRSPRKRAGKAQALPLREGVDDGRYNFGSDISVSEFTEQTFQNFDCVDAYACISPRPWYESCGMLSRRFCDTWCSCRARQPEGSEKRNHVDTTGWCSKLYSYSPAKDRLWTQIY